jgi:hypothetical protein
MAVFSIEIADSDVERVINAVCANYKRPDNIVDNNGNTIENPESKAVFANKMVRQFLSDHVQKYEIDLLKQQIENSITLPTINDPQI